MKILLDLTSLDDNLSGIERYCLNIAKNIIINDKNKENQYILLFKNKVHHQFFEIVKENNIETKVINGKNKIFFSQVILPLALYFIKADKYVFLAFPSPILFHKKNIYNTIHDLTAWLYPETMKFISMLYFRIAIKNAIYTSKKIITVSQNSKKDILNKFHKADVEVIYNGVSKELLDFDYNEDLSKLISEQYKLPSKYILCLGTVEPRKNLDLLIDSFIDLKINNMIEEKLVIVGRFGWKFEKIINKININNLKDDVIFTGFVEDSHLPYIYYNCEFFVFPSKYEGFGIPPLEAMALGAPVLVSNTSSLPEVVGDAGILFQNNNIKDLSEKILSIISMDSRMIDKYKELGKQRAKEFSWEIESKKIRNVISSDN